MSILQKRLEEIAQAPEGPQVAAFFDYDGTLIDGFSAQAIYRDRVRRMELGPTELARTLLVALRGVETEQDYAAVLELNKSALAGKTVEEMAEWGRRLFREETAAQLRPEMWRIVRAHRERGHRIVVASSATEFQIGPIAAEIDADHALSTRMEVIDGVLTGAAVGRPLWGPGKAAAVRALAREHDLDLRESFAYSDGDEDAPYLESVGRPMAVCPRHALRALAESRDWPILDLPPARPRGRLDLARTLGYYGSFVGGAGVGAVAGLLTRNWDIFSDVAVPAGNDVGLALAGVSVRVVSGEEYLTSARPCVFVFNHQSKLDAPVIIKLLRQQVTGVAKKEVRNIPVLGSIFAAGGVVFIDRADRTKALEQMAPAVAKLRDEGISLALAPEGTRSVSPRLGPFKKGAFHIAMQAGVPIVPVVLRNTGEVMWRGAQLLHPGTVEVCVLPPVDTSDWQPEDVDVHAEAVRDMFEHTLAYWPNEEA